jgi:hypothetical protein
VELLKNILSANPEQRQKLIAEFQKSVWDNEKQAKTPADEILAELAYDLDYYVPDEKARSQFSGYYGDERLVEEINHSIKKLEELK